MDKIEPKRLVDAGICVSFAEARRLLLGADENKILKLIQAKEAEKWGRRLIRTEGSHWENISDRFE